MKYGLIGETLKHSFSKEIHEKLGNYKYDLCELNENEFKTFMDNKDFLGVNVTIPYKQKIIPYLDVISDEAKKIGAVNCIINQDNKLFGYNTDYLGLKMMLEINNIEICNKNVLILGTGGTSSTAYHVLNDMNAKSIIKVSRIAKDDVISYDKLDSYYNSTDIIINTTPCGMYPNNDDLLIDISKFINVYAVIDVIYNPLRSNLLIQAKQNNKIAIGGLMMLVFQAAYAINYFKNITLDKKVILDYYKHLFKTKENIVLIGMPSCGKSGLGKRLSYTYNRKFIDTDEEIKKIIKMEISEFFTLYGESKFREIESEVIANVSKQSGLVISTGGGVVLNENNINKLKQNGRIYFIDRSLNKLQTTKSRPLSSSYDKLKELYLKRYPLYEKYCDVKVNGDLEYGDKIKIILKEFEGSI